MAQDNETKRSIQLPLDRIQGSQFAYTEWVATAEEKTTPQDVMDPAYFAHKAAELREYDEIKVRIDTGEWMLHLLVVEKGRGWVRTRLLNKWDLTTEKVGDLVSAAVDSRYECKFKGSHLKWCVIRKQDGEVLSKTHSDEMSARRWLIDYESKITATV
jgi:hypothetical protein